MEKWCRKCAPKGSPRPFFYFYKQPKTAIACKKFFYQLRFLKEYYQKPLKKLTLFFLSNPVPSNGKSYKKTKRCLKLVTSLSSGYELSSEKFFY